MFEEDDEEIPEDSGRKAFGHWEDWRPFKVVKRVNEDAQGNVVSFYLAPQDGVKLPRYLPGQYVTVQLWVPTANCFQSRQYALSDAWNEDYYRVTAAG